MVRPAVEADRWRIAEILVFAKRMAYRPIFQDDFYSFHLLNVHDTAQEVDPSAALVWEEDGILKGVLTFGPARDQDCLDCCEVYELYIDPCFQREGIGDRLMGEVLGKTRNQPVVLWCLEPNRAALDFYHSQGFCPDGARRLVEGTPVWEIRLRRPAPEPF